VVRISASVPVKPMSWTLLSIVFLHLPPGKAPAARGPCRDHATCKGGETGQDKARAGMETSLHGATAKEGRRVRTRPPRASGVGFDLDRPALG